MDGTSGRRDAVRAAVTGRSPRHRRAGSRGSLCGLGRAYAALARGDSTRALELFDSRPDTLCFGSCTIDELVHIQLLAARKRDAQAAARLERPQVGFSGAILPVEVFRALERGRVNERLGNRERAIEGYSLVVRAWRNPDPELQPYVDEARAALLRLSAEKASSAETQ